MVFCQDFECQAKYSQMCVDCSDTVCLKCAGDTILSLDEKGCEHCRTIEFCEKCSLSVYAAYHKHHSHFYNISTSIHGGVSYEYTKQYSYIETCDKCMENYNQYGLECVFCNISNCVACGKPPLDQGLPLGTILCGICESGYLLKISQDLLKNPMWLLSPNCIPQTQCQLFYTKNATTVCLLEENCPSGYMEVRIENSTAKKCVQHYQKRMGNIYVSSNIEEPQENPFNDIDKPLDNLAIAYQTALKGVLQGEYETVNIILMKGNHYLIDCEGYWNYKDEFAYYVPKNNRYNCTKMLKEGKKSLNFDIDALNDQMKHVASSKRIYIKGMLCSEFPAMQHADKCQNQPPIVYIQSESFRFWVITNLTISNLKISGINMNFEPTGASEKVPKFWKDQRRMLCEENEKGKIDVDKEWYEDMYNKLHMTCQKEQECKDTLSNIFFPTQEPLYPKVLFNIYPTNLRQFGKSYSTIPSLTLQDMHFEFFLKNFHSLIMIWEGKVKKYGTPSQYDLQNDGSAGSYIKIINSKFTNSRFCKGLFAYNFLTFKYHTTDWKAQPPLQEHKYELIIRDSEFSNINILYTHFKNKKLKRSSFTGEVIPSITTTNFEYTKGNYKKVQLDFYEMDHKASVLNIQRFPGPVYIDSSLFKDNENHIGNLHFTPSECGSQINLDPSLEVGSTQDYYNRWKHTGEDEIFLSDSNMCKGLDQIEEAFDDMERLSTIYIAKHNHDIHICNCQFIGNFGTYGGAITIDAYSGKAGSLILFNNTFKNNYAYYSGGAVYMNLPIIADTQYSPYTPIYIVENNFIGNNEWKRSNGGAMTIRGRLIDESSMSVEKEFYISDKLEQVNSSSSIIKSANDVIHRYKEKAGSMILDQNEFVSNFAGYKGTALYILNIPFITLSNSIFKENKPAIWAYRTMNSYYQKYFTNSDHSLGTGYNDHEFAVLHLLQQTNIITQDEAGILPPVKGALVIEETDSRILGQLEMRNVTFEGNLGQTLFMIPYEREMAASLFLLNVFNIEIANCSFNQHTGIDFVKLELQPKIFNIEDGEKYYSYNMVPVITLEQKPFSEGARTEKGSFLLKNCQFQNNSNIRSMGPFKGKAGSVLRSISLLPSIPSPGIELSIFNCSFENNYYYGGRALVYIEDEGVNVTLNNFTNNGMLNDNDTEIHPFKGSFEKLLMVHGSYIFDIQRSVKERWSKAEVIIQSNTFNYNKMYESPGIRIYTLETESQEHCGRIKLENNNFRGNIGYRGGNIVSRVLGAEISVSNSVFENNLLIQSGANIEIELPVEQKDLEALLVNITFNNCYNPDKGCLYAHSPVQSPSLLTLRNITLKLPYENWKHAFTNSLISQNLDPELISTLDNLDECIGYPDHFFNFERASSQITNFKFQEEIKTYNSSCFRANMEAYPFILFYNQIKFSSFGRLMEFPELRSQEAANSLIFAENFQEQENLDSSKDCEENIINANMMKYSIGEHNISGLLIGVQSSEYLYIAATQFKNNYNMQFLTSRYSLFTIQNSIINHNHYIAGPRSLIMIVDKSNNIQNSYFAANNVTKLIMITNSNSESFILYNSTFKDNVCKKTLIEIYKGQIVIHNSSFNETEGEALGMVLKGLEAEIHISNSLFSNTLETHFDSLSGFIHIFTSNLQFINSSIHYGAGQTTGAIYSANSNINISHSMINSSVGFAMIFSSSDKVVNIENMKGIIEREGISETVHIQQAESVLIKDTSLDCGNSRCLYLDAQNISIFSSNFSGNGGNNAEYGGCAYLTGGVIEMFNISFSNCKAMRGGGLSISNQLLDPRYYSSKLNDMLGLKSPSRSLQAKEPLQPTISLIEIHIDNCSAIYEGGGLHIRDSNGVLLRNSSFVNNSVIESKGTGGALLYQCDNILKHYPCIFAVKDNNFTGNEVKSTGAGIASAIAALPLDIEDTNDFSNNSGGEYGETISKPISYIDSNYNFSNEDPSKRYYGETNINKTSGQINSDSELSLIMMLKDNNSTRIMRDSESTMTVTSNQCDVSNGLIVANRGIFSFANLIVASAPDSYIKVNVSIELRNIDIVVHDNLPLNFTINIYLRPCQKGEKIEHSECRPCAAETYSFLDPHSSDLVICKECPNQLRCAGKNITYPIKGYWRMSPTTTFINKCPNAEACLKGDENHLLGICNEQDGYTGPLCGCCKEGYKLRDRHDCVKCNSTGFQTVIVLVIAIGFFSLIGIIIYATISAADKAETLYPIFAKILLNHMIIIGLLLGFDLNWPTKVATLLRIVGYLPSSINGEILNFECWLNDKEDMKLDYVYVKLIFSAVLPILIIIGWVIFWFVVRLFRRSTNFKNNLIVSSVILIFVVHPAICSCAFAMFGCNKIDTDKRHLAENYRIECWTQTHLKWTFFLALPVILLWGLGIPLFGWYLMKQNKSNLKKHDNLVRYGFLYVGYLPKYYEWEIYIMFRKMLLAAIIVFFGWLPILFQAILGIVVLTLAWVIQSKYIPYSHPKTNDLEQWSITLCILTLVAGSLAFSSREDTSEPYNDDVKYTMFYGLLMPTLLFMGYFLYYMRKELVKVIYRAYRGTTKERYCRMLGCGLKDIETLIEEANKEIEKENIQLEKIQLKLKEDTKVKGAPTKKSRINMGMTYLRQTLFGRKDTLAGFNNSRFFSDAEDPGRNRETIKPEESIISPKFEKKIKEIDKVVAKGEATLMNSPSDTTLQHDAHTLSPQSSLDRQESISPSKRSLVASGIPHSNS